MFQFSFPDFCFFFNVYSTFPIIWIIFFSKSLSICVKTILKTLDDPEGWYGEKGGRRVQDGGKHLLSGSIYWDTTRMTQLKISLIWKYNLASHVKRNKASDISIEPNISSQELKSSVLVLGHVSIRGLLFFKPCVMWPNWIIYNNFWEWTRQPGPSLKHKCWGRLQSAAALCFWMSCCNLNVSSHWELREVT